MNVARQEVGGSVCRGAARAMLKLERLLSTGGFSLSQRCTLAHGTG